MGKRSSCPQAAKPNKLTDFAHSQCKLYFEAILFEKYMFLLFKKPHKDIDKRFSNTPIQLYAVSTYALCSFSLPTLFQQNSEYLIDRWSLKTTYSMHDSSQVRVGGRPLIEECTQIQTVPHLPS